MDQNGRRPTRREATPRSSQAIWLTARSNWLRAISYYQAAASPFDFPGQNRRRLGRRRCAIVPRITVGHRQPAGEIVAIPWTNATSRCRAITCRRAAGRTKPAPAVICIGEPGHRKEEFLYKVARHALERGLSLLAVDVLGDEPDTLARNDAGGATSSNPRSAISWTICPTGTMSMIAGLRSWPTAGVLPLSREAIAFDQRFAAAVCDGGIWDAQERSFLRRRAAALGADMLHGTESSRMTRNIACPLLITDRRARLAAAGRGPTNWSIRWKQSAGTSR